MTDLITEADVNRAYVRAQQLDPRRNAYREGYCHSDDLRYQDAMDEWRRLRHLHNTQRSTPCPDIETP